MTSKRGMLTSTLLKISGRSESSSTFFVGMDLEGKGRGIYFGAKFVLALSSILAPTFVGFRSYLPLLKVITLPFPFVLIIGCARIFPEPCCYNRLTVVTNCPI